MQLGRTLRINKSSKSQGAGSREVGGIVHLATGGPVTPADSEHLHLQVLKKDSVPQTESAWLQRKELRRLKRKSKKAKERASTCLPSLQRG
jgi:hypothetical protein